jgi:hypothetical protein
VDAARAIITALVAGEDNIFVPTHSSVVRVRTVAVLIWPDDDTTPVVTQSVNLRGVVSGALRFDASRQLSGTLAVEGSLGCVHRREYAKGNQGVRHTAARTDNRV